MNFHLVFNDSKAISRNVIVNKKELFNAENIIIEYNDIVRSVHPIKSLAKNYCITILYIQSLTIKFVNIM